MLWALLGAAHEQALGMGAAQAVSHALLIEHGSFSRPGSPHHLCILLHPLQPQAVHVRHASDGLIKVPLVSCQYSGPSQHAEGAMCDVA